MLSCSTQNQNHLVSMTATLSEFRQFLMSAFMIFEDSTCLIFVASEESGGSLLSIIISAVLITIIYIFQRLLF